jgi:protein ImuB
MREVRALRTLALLDLETRPAPAAIDRVTIVIDPTPGRVVQHTLYTRAQPTPEQLSTLLARLGALMGQDRFGAAAAVDSDRPGAFAMRPFATEHQGERKARKVREENYPQRFAALAAFAFPGEPSALSPEPCLSSALRRCRQPVPARVAVVDGRPVRVTTDRRGFAGGSVIHAAGPWRTSGEWWLEKSEVRSTKYEDGGDRAEPSFLRTSDFVLRTSGPWNRDEWDLALSDGAVYRVFCDRDADRWFIDAIAD